MPQLDITAYFSEYLWTSVSFFTFYYFLSKFFLPAFARALLFEQKKYSEPLQKTFGGASNGEKDTFSGILWTKGKKLFRGFFLVETQAGYSQKPFFLRQKKTELCTTRTEFLESYPAFLLKTKKNTGCLHQSFLEYSSN